MKKNKLLLKITFMVILFFLVSEKIHAQVTTATLSGTVKDSKGTVIPSATVTIEFADAGIKQVLITKADGRFTVPNLRVGGPIK